MFKKPKRKRKGKRQYSTLENIFFGLWIFFSLALCFAVFFLYVFLSL